MEAIELRREGERAHEAGELGRAAEVLGESLQLHPESAAGHNLMGIVQYDLGRMEPALEHFRRAAEIDPKAAGAWSNLGMVLKTEGRFEAAIMAHDKAVSIAPQNLQFRLNRAVALLRAGRMAEAWPDYECRMRLSPGIARLPMERLLPSHLQDLTGLRILVLHEEGFGDTIQFARYLPMLAARGAHVMVHVPKPLVRLLRGMDGIAEIIEDPSANVAFHYFCPFFSLPRAFGTTLETIPAAIPYLHAPAAKPTGQVGLVWAGQARPWLEGFAALDRRRSTGLAMFAPLARLPVTFVSLQKGPAAAEAANPPAGMTLLDPMAEVDDFADTAAIIAGLEWVVTVDTSVAHLAGAMGKPVLLLDRYDSCWRWLSGRSDSPWYPTMRIFRQERPGEWGPVMRRVAKALSD